MLGEIYRYVHHGDFLSYNGFLISIYGETTTTAFNVFFKVAIYKLENILHLKLEYDCQGSLITIVPI